MHAVREVAFHEAVIATAEKSQSPAARDDEPHKRQFVGIIDLGHRKLQTATFRAILLLITQFIPFRSSRFLRLCVLEFIDLAGGVANVFTHWDDLIHRCDGRTGVQFTLFFGVVIKVIRRKETVFITNKPVSFDLTQVQFDTNSTTIGNGHQGAADF